MKTARHYLCHVCGAMKTVISPEAKTDIEHEMFECSFLDEVVCGWRGCLNFAIKVSDKEMNNGGSQF